MLEQPVGKKIAALEGEIPAVKPEELTVTTSVASLPDWPALKSIMLEAMVEEPDAIGTPYDEEAALPDSKWQGEATDPRRIFILGKSDEVPIGVVAARKEAPDRWNLYSMYINKKWRGMGISKDLLNKVLREVKARRGAKANLLVGANETTARALYDKTGFKSVDAVWGKNLSGRSVPSQYKMEIDLSDFES